MKAYSKHIDWGQVKITKDIMKWYVIPKYGKMNWMKDDSWTDIILDDVYNTFYRDEEEETEVAKESEDMALSVMKGDKGKGNEAEHDHFKVNKGKVHNIQNRLKKLKVDLARAIKAKQVEHDKGKGTQLDDVDLDDHDDYLDAHDDDLDALDLENRIKKLEDDFGRLLKIKKEKEAKKANNAKLAKEAKKANKAELKAKEAMLTEVVQVSSDEDDSSDEGLFGDEDVVLFNDVKYPLIDAEIKMFKEIPTTSRALIASTFNAQAASTLAPRGRKIAMIRAPNNPNAPPPSATRKRKSKK
ncbi:hypothetical protein Tco_0884405 [Tanacetum coccineum]